MFSMQWSISFENKLIRDSENGLTRRGRYWYLRDLPP